MLRVRHPKNVRVGMDGWDDSLTVKTGFKPQNQLLKHSSQQEPNAVQIWRVSEYYTTPETELSAEIITFQFRVQSNHSPMVTQRKECRYIASYFEESQPV